ncbi:MAG: ABC transporter ATP-binding protein [Acidimicrobiia bacterium]
MRYRALRRVLPYLQPFRRAIAVTLVAGFVGIAAAAAIPQVTKHVVDGPLKDGDPGALARWALVVLALGMVEGIAVFVRRDLLGALASGMETALRDDLYAHLQQLDVGFHDEWESGQLLSRAVSDIGAVRRFVGWGATFALINLMTFVVVLGFLVSLDWQLSMIVVAMAVPLVWLIKRQQQHYAEVTLRLQGDQGDLATLVEESATGIRAIKSFGRRRLMNERFEQRARTLHASSMARVRLNIRYEWMLNLMPGTALGIVLLFGAESVGNGRLSLGGLIAFITYLLMVVWPIESLGWILGMAEEAATAAVRVFEVFDTTPRVVDEPGAVDLADTAAAHVRFEHVEFCYPGSEREILRDVNLEIQPGETVALVGLTGSGKTTLAMLVPRLHDPTAGRITIDGIDIRTVTRHSLRHAVAVGFEDPTLFSASVRENVTLGNPHATDQEIDDALLVAQAQFVHDLPWGLETRIGEQGMSLSGGQRQRVALARAILAKPKVIVLDDPLSALDVHTEAVVESALRRVLKGVTALIVVHRPSTVALADRAALLWDGTIAATGTHSELLEREPRYRAILAQQADSELTA